MARRRRANGWWRYKNIAVVLVGFAVAVRLSQEAWLRDYLVHLGNMGYVGAFFAGMLLVSIFTVATGVLILIPLAQTLHPVEIGLMAGLGGLVGDLVVFHLVRDNLADEIVDIYNHMDHKKHLKKLFHSRYFAWTLPVLGSLIIASPLPDELGVSLMGLSRMGTIRFLLVSFTLNALGAFAIVSAALWVKG